MNFDLFVFDLDGTLLDSIPDLTDSLNHAAAKLNLPTVAQEAVPAMVGDGVRMLIARAFGMNTQSAEFALAFDTFMSYYEQNLVRRSTVFDGVEQLFRSFAHVHKAILSNKPHPLTLEIVQLLGWQPHFARVMGSAPDWDRKPSPQALLHIIQSLGVPKDRTLMVGDGDADVLAGKNAGVHTCALLQGYRTAAELERLKPDFVFDTLIDFVHHFAPKSA